MKRHVPKSPAEIEAAAKRAASALLRDDGRDADLPEGDDLPDDPEGHLAMGIEE